MNRWRLLAGLLIITVVTCAVAGPEATAYALSMLSTNKPVVKPTPENTEPRLSTVQKVGLIRRFGRWIGRNVNKFYKFIY